MPRTLIATETRTSNIPFRPWASHDGEYSMPGGYEATNDTCDDSFTFNITFNHFTPPDESLPDNVSYGIAYNTGSNGFTPTGNPLTRPTP